ncbi:hypothetical protein FKP32DRAFT_1536588, partial [Trametes sanguinea]
SFRIDLPATMRQRGVHDVFHASLLWVHEPNNDRLFPGRLDSQVLDLEDREGEWAIERLLSHCGRGQSLVFEALWKSGDCTWLPLNSVAHLSALGAYLETAGV